MAELAMDTAPKKERSDEIEIDLGKVAEACKRYWVLLLVSTLVCGILGFLVSNFGMTKTYAASVQMLVNTNQDSDVVSNDSVNSAKNLVATYSIIVKGSTVLTQVAENLDNGMTYEQLSSLISVDVITDTQVFKVTAKTNDVELSRSIIRELCAVAPAEIEDAVEAGSCKIVSDIDYDTAPVSPNVAKYTAVAAFAGLLLALAYALFRVLSKQFIVTDTDVSEQLGLPVLGVIPQLNET